MRNRILLVLSIIIVIGLTVLLILKFKKTSNSNNEVIINAGAQPLEGQAQFSGKKSVRELLALANSLGQKAQLLEEKAVYQKLVSDFPSSKEVGNWQKKAEELSLKVIFSPQIISTSKEYVVQPLDNLTKTAKQFNTTVELIKRSNNLSSDNINPGKKLKIWTGKFSVFVDKSQNILVLKSDEEIIKAYVVSTGANNSSPVGTFKIVNKLINPSWYKTGAVIPAGSPENILGTRWMGFDLATYGIHGTSQPESLGAQATAGCVRMLNAEVEELYTFLPVGTEVTIVD